MKTIQLHTTKMKTLTQSFTAVFSGKGNHAQQLVVFCALAVLLGACIVLFGHMPKY